MEAVFLEPMLIMVISQYRLKVQKSAYSVLLKTEQR